MLQERAGRSVALMDASPAHATAADPPAWLAEIDPTPGPPFLAMGVRALAAAWLTVDDGPALAAKRRILAAHRDEVVAVLPGVDEAVAELAAAVADTATTTAGPDPGSARTVPSNPGEVLAGAARRVAEDLCVLVPRDGAWVLGAGCVCFPSHWRLRDKLGRPVAEIHAPVPHYATELATRVDRFLDRLTPARGAWRRNWLVHTDDRLFAPVPAPPPDPPIGAADAGERLWLRSERQTLRRLAHTGAVVFTIRTQQAPLAVVRHRPELAARMTASVASWSGDLVAYRGGEAVRRPLLAWLRAVADHRT